MHSRRVDRVYRLYSGERRGYHRLGDVVYELAENRVFFRGPAYGGERENRTLLAEHLLYLQVGEQVPAGIVPHVVAERSLGLEFGCNLAQNAEVRVARDHVALVHKIAEAPPAEHSGKREFREVFGHGHHRGDGMCGRAAQEHAHLERAAFFQRLPVVARDVAVNLVVYAAFVGREVVARNLYAVHAQVCGKRFCAFVREGRYLREREERPAVLGPAYDLREVGQRAFLEIADAPGTHREGADSRLHGPHECCGACVPEKFCGVRLELHRGLGAFDGIPEQKIHALAGPEDVACRLEPAALHLLEKQRRPLAVKSLPCNFRHLQVRVHFLVDTLEHPRLFQVEQGLFECGIHGGTPGAGLTRRGAHVERFEGLRLFLGFYGEDYVAGILAGEYPVDHACACDDAGKSLFGNAREPLEREFIVAGGHVALGHELVAGREPAEGALAESHGHLVVLYRTDDAGPADDAETVLQLVLDGGAGVKFFRENVVELGLFADSQVEGSVCKRFQDIWKRELLPRRLTELHHTLINLAKKARK